MFESIMLLGFAATVAAVLIPNRKEEALKDFPTFIIEGCEAVAGTLVPCVKQPVHAVVITVAGTKHFGANWMTNEDVTVCPRVELNCPSGEGYEHCKDTCNQEFHAEPSAITACINDGQSPVGATLYLTGHTYCCDNCIAAMTEAGITKAICLDSGKTYIF